MSRMSYYPLDQQAVGTRSDTTDRTLAQSATGTINPIATVIEHSRPGSTESYEPQSRPSVTYRNNPKHSVAASWFVTITCVFHYILRGFHLLTVVCLTSHCLCIVNVNPSMAILIPNLIYLPANSPIASIMYVYSYLEFLPAYYTFLVIPSFLHLGCIDLQI